MKPPRHNSVSSGAAHGFERYAFGPDFVLESESWQEAAEKIDSFLRRRTKRSSEAVSYYSEGEFVLWREYQLLFMCQYLEFRITELIGHLHRSGQLQDEFVLSLTRHPKASPERSKDPQRLTSPASLLVDLGYNLGGLLSILEKQTLPFDRKSELLGALSTFNTGRNDFIHRSFSSGKKSRAATTAGLIGETLRCGKLVLALIADIIG